MHIDKSGVIPQGVSTYGTDDWTPYSYVRNNPIAYSDPTGMSSMLGAGGYDPGPDPCPGWESQARDQFNSWYWEDKDNEFLTPYEYRSGKSLGYIDEDEDKAPSPTGGNESKDESAIAGSYSTDQALPNGPDGLGKVWKELRYENPNGGKLFENRDTGEKLEWNPGRPDGDNPWDRQDHWHHGNKGSSNKEMHKEHYRPGQMVKKDKNQLRSLWEKAKSIPPRRVVEAGTTAIIIYLIISEGSRFIPWRNLIPVP